VSIFVYRLLIQPSVLIMVCLATLSLSAKEQVTDAPNYLTRAQTSEAKQQPTSKLEQVKANVKQYLPSFEIDLIRKSEFDGFYEILSQGQVFFATEDGKYLIAGKVFSFENGMRDLSNEATEAFDMSLAPVRVKKISEVPESEMIIFKAQNQKHVITVFTDVDCGYCQKLHQTVGELNERGVTVRYLAYPRAGIGSPSYDKLRSIWCANDQQAAMTRGKLKRQFGNDICADPISKHYQLVPQLGIRGTPAIFLESGRYLKGYVEPEIMLQIIEADVTMNNGTGS
jgi:thiol:disulfide interchange protein DsbC